MDNFDILIESHCCVCCGMCLLTTRLLLCTLRRIRDAPSSVSVRVCFDAIMCMVAQRALYVWIGKKVTQSEPRASRNAVSSRGNYAQSAARGRREFAACSMHAIRPPWEFSQRESSRSGAQVPGAKVALQHNLGLPGNVVVTMSGPGPALPPPCSDAKIHCFAF